LRVDEVIGVHITSTVSDQSDVRVDSFENTSILHDNGSDNEECHKETEDNNLVNVDSVETQYVAEDIETNNEVIQKNDRRVRFTLPASEEGNTRETYSEGIVAEHSANEDPVTSNGTLQNVVCSDFLMSHSLVPDRIPVEQLHQIGYTQLRELNCSLETRLGSKSVHCISVCNNGTSCI